MKIDKTYLNFFENQKITLILLIVFIGIFLRLYQINFEDFWYDEIISFWVTDPKINFNETIVRQNKFGDQITFYFILKFFHNIFDYNVMISRYLPLTFGILTIPLVAFLDYRINKNKINIFTIFLISTNIYLINYSNELRVYSFVFFLSSVNLIFFFETESFLNKKIYRNIYGIAFFISSILLVSSHFFGILILISLFIYTMHSIIYFKKKFNFLLTILGLSIFISLIINYNFIFNQSYNWNWIPPIRLNFFYDFFFSKYFGSKIMGIIYLLSLFYLIFKYQKKLFRKYDRLNLLIIILATSYILPILYSIIIKPILIDRYIIFILIPIIMLISNLSIKLKNNKFKFLFIFVILFSSTLNTYMEIFFRKNIKPEFTKSINYISKSKIKNFILIGTGPDKIYLENYIKNLNQSLNNHAKFINLYQTTNNQKEFWAICYQPIFFKCKFKSNKSIKIKRIKEKKFYLVENHLFSLNK